ncbi:CDP-glycerol glycerophosphotransferase family protein [Blautia sp. MSJ-19]|uniref:CDP-glycerol glycerophosphotransferase family protein n=1 Tax=Blautia sp. MSJ-19 TaxID=2841517 RepID=UPI001C0F3AB9|nr:CDP-glycerol glycerophosphotransferase family protein [Blautia sp. MSJ-19]MBU5480144.1 CDP-glycerol glycerophosphotransferase family protein [Blautia sp. MSJ-19]
MKRVMKRLHNLVKNFFVGLASIFIGKNERTVLIGAWMGDKFADNSRFLFQYLDNRKNELNIEHVVWATRSKQVLDLLETYGYECVLIGTSKSFYWHCKSGIHVICNVYGDEGKYTADIDTSLSAFSKKVQLWHGNGIKCVEGTNRMRTHERKFHKIIRCATASGGWTSGNYYLLCKSDLDAEFFEIKFGANKTYCIDAAYPRTCRCEQYLPEEETVLNRLNGFDGVILYLPTFRESYEEFVHPLDIEEVRAYIERSNYLWIEKPHSADENGSSVEKHEGRNYLLLHSEFDINILFPYIDLLVTDYSSAMLDALYFRKKILYYVPDYDYYVSKDRGFLMDYDSICITKKVEKPVDLLERLKTLMSSTVEYNENAERIRKLFWKYDNWTCQEIWKAILNKIQ